jgi:Spy/CpxP family protein refolding chaperone
MRKSDTFLLAACMALTMTAVPALAQNGQNMMGDHNQGMMNDGDHGQGTMGNGGHMMGDEDHGQGTMGNGGHMQWGPYDGR